jgi:hypothetical protein
MASALKHFEMTSIFVFQGSLSHRDPPLETACPQKRQPAGSGNFYPARQSFPFLD